MKNFEQEFLELVLMLQDTRRLSESNIDTLLDFHSEHLYLQNIVNRDIERIEELEADIFALKRDNEMLRDELDKVWT